MIHRKTPRLARLLRHVGLAALCTALLAACGGGQDGTAAEPMASPVQAVLAPSACTPQAVAEGAAQQIDQRCVRASPLMRAHARPQALAAAPAAVATLTPDQLMDWAERQYPHLFAPAAQPTGIFPPYTYRHYPATGNYIGVAGTDIYVMGPLSQGQIALVGTLADFACVAANIGCEVPGAPTITAITPYDGQAYVEFAAPASSGSSPISRYSVSCASGFDSIGTATGTASPLVVGGLVNGRKYSCIVTATNQQGTSAPSAAVTVTPVLPSSQPTTIRLVSDSGDYIGGGRTYLYNRTNTQIGFSASGNRISIQVNGDEWWHADFVLPASQPTWVPGTYTGLTRYPFHDAAKGGLDWGGEGRGCNTLKGSINVLAATYNGSTGELDSINFTFVQHCEGGTAALRGTIAWGANDTSGPPGPVVPVPTTLWKPTATMPASGNYAYLQSDTGDYIGQGQTTLYTGTQAPQVNFNGSSMSASVGGYDGTFVAMQGTSPLKVGYYPDLSRYPFHNPFKGGLSWSGNGRGCNTLSGWFAIDEITVIDNQLQHVLLRFEQHCEGGTAALRGQIRWTRG